MKEIIEHVFYEGYDIDFKKVSIPLLKITTINNDGTQIIRYEREEIDFNDF